MRIVHRHWQWYVSHGRNAGVGRTPMTTATSDRYLVTPLGVPLALPYTPHYPHPPQEAFLALDCLEAFYGGAAARASRDALLMAALQYVHVPRYAAIIFRRTYEDLSLPGALIPRSKEWLGPTLGMQAWNEQRHRWTFPSGATLQLRLPAARRRPLRYQGAEFQFVGVDEASQIREAQLRYMFSRLRKPDVGSLSGVPLRMRLASNPGDRSHEYLKRRYIDKQVDPTTRRTPRSARAGACSSGRGCRTTRASTSGRTVESLSHLEPEVRAQLLDGDWDARQPGDWYFDDGHLAAVAELGREYEDAIRDGDLSFVAGEAKHLGIDWGDHTHGLLGLPLEAGGWLIAREFVGEASEPSASTRRLLALGDEFDLPWGRVFFDGAGKSSQLTFNATAEKLIGYRRPRAKAIHFGAQAPRTAATARRSMKGAGCTYLRRLARRTAEHGGVQVLAISPRCPVLLRQLKAIERDHESVDGKWLKDDDQHGPDAAVALVTTTAVRHRVPADAGLKVAA
jgi:hypothetical protein